MPAFAIGKNERLNAALIFATNAHGDQVRKGNEHIPYIFHPVDVANEVIYYSGLPEEKIGYASVVALLHDVVEDSDVSLETIKEAFGEGAAISVAALSKDSSVDSSHLSKWRQLEENLERIKRSPEYLRQSIKCVKLADRISNLKSFPHMWSKEKISNYLDESVMIAEALGSASETLHARLLVRIAEARKILSLRA